MKITLFTIFQTIKRGQTLPTRYVFAILLLREPHTNVDHSWRVLVLAHLHTTSTLQLVHLLECARVCTPPRSPPNDVVPQSHAGRMCEAPPSFAPSYTSVLCRRSDWCSDISTIHSLLMSLAAFLFPVSREIVRECGETGKTLSDIVVFGEKKVMKDNFAKI